MLKAPLSERLKRGAAAILPLKSGEAQGFAPPTCRSGQAFAVGRRSIPQKTVGIIGRCDSEFITPRRHLSLQQAQDYVKAQWIVWLEPDVLARETHLYERPKERKTVNINERWMGKPSPYMSFEGVNGIEYRPPQLNVMQMVP